MADNEEFISEFLIEASENLDQLDQDLVALEKNPHAPDRLASIFRTIHTIKGTCGFFGFTKLSNLSHHGEHLLGLLREDLLVVPQLLLTGVHGLLVFCHFVPELLALEHHILQGTLVLLVPS